MTTIEKVLSANDTGETGGHQAGLLIPRQKKMIEFFPKLDASAYNPRCVIDVVDDSDTEWTFNYIYYNNSFFDGTRNEYRVTGMTAFFREHILKSGDSLIFEQNGERKYRVRVRRKNAVEVKEDGRKVLHLSGNWMVIDTD
jgi:Restriction endonuclease EcoRII, N-terminal